MDAVHMDYGLLETPVRQLSGGEQRRLSLLRAIAVEPDYLIMDEVTSGLDLISADAVLTLVENFVKLSAAPAFSLRIAERTQCVLQIGLSSCGRDGSPSKAI